jgi:hypothetical protein
VFILTQPDQFAAAPDLYAELGGVLGQEALDGGLRNAEDIRMCGVQPVRLRLGDAGEVTTDRVLLAEREEPLQQSALVHHLDAARVQAERADLPGRLCSFSSTSACRPCSRNSLASIMPVGPPPATITSITTTSAYSTSGNSGIEPIWWASSSGASRGTRVRTGSA